MLGTNPIARMNAATQNATATLLLQRIAFYCRLKSGGVDFEGKRWSYRPVEEWADEIAEADRTTRRSLSLLKDRNLILSRMAWAGGKGARKWVLHVALTARAEAILDGSDPLAWEGEGGQKWSDPPAKSGETIAAKSGETVSPEMAAPYKEPVDLPVDQPEDLPNALGCVEAKTGETASMKNVKSVMDIEAAVKAHKHLHKPDTVGSLVSIWRDRVKEITGSYVHVMETEKHQFRGFLKKCPPGKADAVLMHVLDDWIMFVKKCETMDGAKNIPTIPSIGFLLQHANAAVILAEPKKPTPKKQEAPAPVSLQSQVQLVSPPPKPEIKKPQSLAEIWADPDDEEE